MRPAPPSVARSAVRLLVPGHVREWILGDLDEAWYGWVARSMDVPAARRWYYRQAAASVVSVWLDLVRREVNQGGGDGMSGWIRRLGQAGRALARRPGYTAAVVATLGLGIGATTAVYSVVDGVLLRPLDLPAAEELVILWTRSSDGEDTNSSGPNLMDLRAGVSSFEELYAFSRDRAVIEDPQGRRRTVPALQVTAPALHVLGIVPALGRDFRPADEAEGAAPVVLLSHRLWASAYGGDPGAVGRTLSVGGRSAEIVGVLPRGLRLPMADEAELVLPFALPVASRGRDMSWLGGIARMARGATLESTTAEARATWEGLREEYPEAILDDDLSVIRLQSYLVQDVRPALLVLLGSTGFLLLMACVNAGGLLAIRGRGRLQELGVRQALGAGRRRLVGELASEGMLLLGAAMTVGGLVAYGALDVIIRLAPPDLPRIGEVGLDLRVLAVTTALGLIAGMGTILLPARRIVSAVPSHGLGGGARGGISGRGENRRRALLITSQVAMAVVLLAGAALTIRSMATILAVDPGYRVDGVITASVELPGAEYTDRASRTAVFQDLEDFAASLPGVVSVGTSLLQPMQPGQINFEVAIDGTPAAAPGIAPLADLQIASGGYFRSLDIPLLQGRLFGAQDGPDAERVAMVSQSLARELWPRTSALGRTVGFISAEGREPGTWRTVVGVVEDVRFQSLDDVPRGTLFVPVSQLAQNSGTLLVHVQGDPGPVAEALRSGVPKVAAGLSEPEISTLEAELATTLAQSRFRTVLLAVFAFLALLLAGVGIYGTVAYAVGRRRAEIGLRVALGAEPTAVARTILGQGLTPVAVGLVLGLGVALLSGRLIQSLLYEISPNDPVALGGAGITLAAVALLACVGPALRASHIDPSESLRQE